MATVQATQINKGAVVSLDGVYHKVVERDHKTPGNKRGIIHLKLKNLEGGGHVSKRFASGDFLETAYISKRSCQYLYPESPGFVFMDNESYEQFTLSAELVGDQMKYVPLNADVSVGYIDERPMELDLPASVTLTVVESEPAIRGNTATNVTKLAVMDTGLEVKVPQHINVGELISVDTRNGDFMGRAKE